MNPALLTQNGGSGPLLPYASTTPFPGALGLFTGTPTGSDAVGGLPGQYTAQCQHENGATWLQVKPVGSSLTIRLKTSRNCSGREWGLHLYDVNIALGNLVNTVAIQAAGLRVRTLEPALGTRALLRERPR